MNNYIEMKKQHEKEVNEFPMFFAFSKKQFNEGMKKLGLDPSETNKIYRAGDTGGFYRKSDASAFHEMFKRHEDEKNNAIATDDTFIYNMFRYELGNHEYVITEDISDTLAALGLTFDEINNDKRLLNALQKACKEEKEWYALNG